MAALLVIGIVVTLVMVTNNNKKQSTRNGAKYGVSRFYGAEEEPAQEKPAEEAKDSPAANLMPKGYTDNTGPITANMVAKVRSAGASIQSQITHNPLKRTGGYNAVLNLREMPRGPAVNVKRGAAPSFLSSSALEDQMA